MSVGDHSGVLHQMVGHVGPTTKIIPIVLDVLCHGQDKSENMIKEDET